MPLRLTLIGSPSLVDQDGKDVRAVLAQPKRLALLVYLAAAQPAGFHQRDALLALFWPDFSQEAARAALNRAVYYLRQALGAEVIESRGDAIAIDRSLLRADVFEIEEALARGDTDTALTLCRGDLLAGFHVDDAAEFEQWLDAERQRLSGRVARSAIDAATAAERSGDLERAVALGREACRLLPYSEPLQVDLLRRLEALGNRSEALLAYETFARRLSADLDATPGAELRAIAERLRHGPIALSEATPRRRIGDGMPQIGAPHAPDGSHRVAGAAVTGERTLRLVEEQADPAPVPADAHVLQLPTRRSWPSWRPAAYLLGAAAAVALVIRGVTGTPAPPISRLALAIPANQRFVDDNSEAAIISPDGRAIVYSGVGPDGTRLYYRRLDQLEGTPLPGTDRAWEPHFSPSGDWVVFETRPVGIGSGYVDISKVSVRGGAATRLARVLGGGGLTWGSDGAVYIGGGAGLFRIPDRGGPVTLVAGLDVATREFGDEMPFALPDGRHVLVSAGYEPLPDSAATGVAQAEIRKLTDIRVADGHATVLGGGILNALGIVDGYLLVGRTDGSVAAARFDPSKPRPLTDLIPVPEPILNRIGFLHAAVSSTGDLVYFTATNQSTLTFVDRQGGVLRAMPDPRYYSHPRVSPDGKRIVVAIRTDDDDRSDLWLIDVASGALQRLTTDAASWAPSWSGDGKRIVYIHYSPDYPEVWTIPPDGSARGTRLFPADLDLFDAVMSPDGRYIVATAFNHSTSSDIYLVDLLHNAIPVPLEQSAFKESAPAISPDGHWLAYNSDATGTMQVYVRPFPGNGQHLQVSLHGGTEPHWAADSRQLVYRHGDQFLDVRLDVGAALAVARRDSLFQGTFRDVRTSYGTPLRSDFDLLADGSILGVRPIINPSVIIVQHWTTELRALARGQAGAVMRRGPGAARRSATPDPRPSTTSPPGSLATRGTPGG